MSKPLTIADYLRAGMFHQAVDRMQELLKVGDPSVPVDVDGVRAAYEATRAQLKAEAKPLPFRVRVMYTNPVKPGGAR